MPFDDRYSQLKTPSLLIHPNRPPLTVKLPKNIPLGSNRLPILLPGSFQRMLLRNHVSVPQKSVGFDLKIGQETADIRNVRQELVKVVVGSIYYENGVLAVECQEGWFDFRVGAVEGVEESGSKSFFRGVGG